MELAQRRDDPGLPPRRDRRGGRRGRGDAALTDDDSIVSTYREHGHAIARGVPMERVMADVRQGHRLQPRTRRLDAPVRRRPPVLRRERDRAAAALAIGLALADKMQGGPGDRVLLRRRRVRRGRVPRVREPRRPVAAAGALRCENNLYAMGTAIHRAQAETDLALRAASYGLTSWPVDGMDVRVEKAPAGGRPDPQRWRPLLPRAAPTGSGRTRCTTRTLPRQGEIARWRERDPSTCSSGSRARTASCSGALDAMTAEVTAEIDLAVAARRPRRSSRPRT